MSTRSPRPQAAPPRNEEAPGRAEGSGIFLALKSPVIEAALRPLGHGEAGGVVHGGLSMARYVAVGALLRAFPRTQKSEVLGHVGLGDEDWERGRACWMAALRAKGDDAASLLASWSDAFDQACETLQADPPSIDDLVSARARLAAPAEVPTYLRSAPARIEKPLHATMPSLGVPTVIDLPFHGKLDAPPPAAVPATVRSKLEKTMPTSGSPVTPGRVLPFPSAPRAPRTPRGDIAPIAVIEPPAKATPKIDLTVEQYASLTVELRFWPDQRGATLARYGILDEAAFAEIEAAWTPRIAWEPGVVARWSEACRAYRSWLLERAQGRR